VHANRRVRILAFFIAALAAAVLPACVPGQAPGGGGQGQPGGNALGLLFPLLLTFAIFYFLLIRPQQRQAKARQEMLKALKKGEDVVTTGGLHGKIVGITDKVVTLEVADLGGQKIRLRFDRDQIGRQEKSTEE
jgi:preprotein translocase subunit YajC